MKLLGIIVNWRTADLTIQAAQSLLQEMQDIDGQIIIVDNASGDGSFQKLSERARQADWRDQVRVLGAARNGGYGYGNNIGFRQGLASDDPPDYFYVLNSDAFPEVGSVHALIEFMDTHPDAGIAGSRVHGMDGAPHVTAFRFPTPAGELEATSRLGLVTRAFSEAAVAMEAPEGPTSVDWVAGASMMIRRVLLQEVGLFDETFFLYFEETDLCRRTKDAGWRTYYVPESQVAHVGSASTKLHDLTRRTPTYWFDSRRHYFLKTGGQANLLKANAAWLVGSTLWRLRRVVMRKARQDAPGLLRDFVRHTVGLPRDEGE